jgi:hypothetical protein
MTPPDTIAQLKKDLFSDNWDTAKSASDGLAEIGSPEVINFFISLLEQDNANIRNVAALGLRKLSDNQALEPLFRAINKKENENNRGTMVYALQTLDCSHKLPELFDLLFYGNFEVKMGVSVILDEQTFEFTRQDLYDILHKWEDLQRHPEKSSDLTEESSDFIKDYVDSFLAYLKD